MTKKLENLLNIDAEDTEAKPSKKEAAIVEQEDTFRDIEEFDKIASELPAVKGLGAMADAEINEVADKAMAAYDDLMDLGMNVESRYSGRVFEVAGTMLKTSLDAKIAKFDKKIKMIDLQLKKEKLDRDGSAGSNDIVNGTGYVVTDRNSLLEKLKGLDKDK